MIYKYYPDFFCAKISKSLNEFHMNIQDIYHLCINYNLQTDEIFVNIQINKKLCIDFDQTYISMYLVKFQFEMLVERIKTYAEFDYHQILIYNKNMDTYKEYKTDISYKEISKSRGNLSNQSNTYEKSINYDLFYTNFNNIINLDDEPDRNAYITMINYKIKFNIDLSDVEYQELISCINLKFDYNPILKYMFSISRKYYLHKILKRIIIDYSQVLIAMSYSKFYYLLILNQLYFEYLNNSYSVISNFIDSNALQFACNNYSVTILTDYLLFKYNTNQISSYNNLIQNLISNSAVLSLLLVNKNMYELYKLILEKNLLKNCNLDQLVLWTNLNFGLLWMSNLIYKHFILNIIKHLPTYSVVTLIDTIFVNYNLIIENLIGNEVVVEILDRHTNYYNYNYFFNYVSLNLKLLLSKSYSYVLLRYLVKRRLIMWYVEILVTKNSIQDQRELIDILSFEKGPQYVKLLIENSNDEFMIQMFYIKLNNIKPFIKNKSYNKIVKMLG
eukprot:Mrub_02349.p1 GENE.Mrub_02349~~Mrub_02349.p1  ORF type:complete len:540 (+),score=29.78 Mrub_02349:116-1621(+)